MRRRIKNRGRSEGEKAHIPFPYILQIDLCGPSVRVHEKSENFWLMVLTCPKQAETQMRATDSSMGGEADQFHTTRWTLVMACAHEQSQTGQAALAALCQTYWYPMYAFARRRGHSPADAQDL